MVIWLDASGAVGSFVYLLLNFSTFFSNESKNNVSESPAQNQFSQSPGFSGLSLTM